jgi:hypothetical protein
VIAGADEPSLAAAFAEVERELEAGVVLAIISGVRRKPGLHVVEVENVEVLGRRLAVDHAPRFDRRLFRVALALDDDPLVLGPLGAVLVRIGPQDVGEPALQALIALELLLDLAEEGFGDRPRVAEDADGDVGIARMSWMFRAKVMIVDL